jgi:hypothetical protein
VISSGQYPQHCEIWLNNEKYAVVGVVPRGFHAPLPAVDAAVRVKNSVKQFVYQVSLRCG